MLRGGDHGEEKGVGNNVFAFVCIKSTRVYVEKIGRACVGAHGHWFNLKHHALYWNIYSSML